eukprot:TRINITY_DN2020_c0_g2_i3.p1 TRINITY_DN2020_c0_g2~~TRINITY_DN2020_c0_g2_i3.p1  ORF type:complete len:198 (+),score=25.02 TRINITY_DN2020_c0_g2_i3:56-649(+)
MNDEIEMELQALESIFFEDYRLVDESTISIELLEPGGDPETGRRVELKVTYTAEYPECLPTFGIRGVRGLTRAQVEPLHKLVTKKAETLLGQPMVYDLCTYIQEWIENGAQDPDAAGGSSNDAPVEMMQASKKHGTAVTKENFAEWKAGLQSFFCLFPFFFLLAGEGDYQPSIKQRLTKRWRKSTQKRKRLVKRTEN